MNDADVVCNILESADKIFDSNRTQSAETLTTTSNSTIEISPVSSQQVLKKVA